MHNNLFSIPPELVIRVFTFVAVYDPKTFFSLGLVCKSWKHVLDSFRSCIKHDIVELYENKTVSAFVDYSHIPNAIECHEYVVLPPRFHFRVPLFVHEVNDRLQRIDEDRPSMRQSRFYLEWIMDYVILPCHLPFAANPPSPILSKMLETVKKDYPIKHLQETFLSPTLCSCTPGDPENIIVYEAFKSAGISFSDLVEYDPSVLIHHLATLRRRYGEELYLRDLNMIVSNGFFFTIEDIELFLDNFEPDSDIVPYSKRFDQHNVVWMNDIWFVLTYTGKTTRRLLPCEMDVDNKFFFEAIYDQLMMNTTSVVGREIMHDGFFRLIFDYAMRCGLSREVMDYCLKNYPGEIGLQDLELAMTTGYRGDVFLGYLIDKGFDNLSIARLIMSVKDKADFEELIENIGELILNELPDLKKLFYNLVITEGPLSFGYLVYRGDSDGKKSDQYWQIPMYYWLIAIQRYDEDVVYEILCTEDTYFIESIFRECIFHNMDTSRLSWFLEEILDKISPFQTRFLEDMIAYAQTFMLEDIEDMLLRYAANR